MEFWGLAVGAAIASAAWLYQRAWERQEKRIARYQEVVDRLPYFTVANLSADKIDAMISEHRRLWISAPDDVIISGEKFLDAVEGRSDSGGTKGNSESALGEYVLAMRRDGSMRSALFPRFWPTKIKAKDFRLRSAVR